MDVGSFEMRQEMSKKLLKEGQLEKKGHGLGVFNWAARLLQIRQVGSTSRLRCGGFGGLLSALCSLPSALYSLLVSCRSFLLVLFLFISGGCRLAIVARTD